MGITVGINSIEEMCDLMCDNKLPDLYKEGEYIIHTNGDRYEIGRIVSVHDDGAFVCYHEGETAAKTPYDCMHKLVNRHGIIESAIGGKRWARW